MTIQYINKHVRKAHSVSVLNSQFINVVKYNAINYNFILFNLKNLTINTRSVVLNMRTLHPHVLSPSYKCVT